MAARVIPSEARDLLNGLPEPFEEIPCYPFLRFRGFPAAISSIVRPVVTDVISSATTS
jgi:hypothetical protein